MASDAQQHIVIDTDPGIDDAMALAFLRATPSVRIAAITTVFGNATIDITTRNACYLAAHLGIDAPVIAGASQPLQIPRPPSPAHVHGHNGLGDVEMPVRAIRAPMPGPAHERIVEMVRAAPNQVSILSLGPLTNLALALRHDPGIASLVRQVVVMGGAFGWGRRRGNVSPVAEANVYNDPHAADEVLAAGWPVTMVGLDVSVRCVLTTLDAMKLAAEAGETGQFLWSISRGYEALYLKHDGIQGCCLHDVTAAMYLVRPQLFATRLGPIRVVTAGIAIGQTIQRPAEQSFPPGDWDRVPAQNACSDVNVEQLIRTYSETLAAHARSAAAETSR